MNFQRRSLAGRGVARLLLLAALAFFVPAPAAAQYFGQNKIPYEKLDFKILKTANFDVYFYPEEEAAAAMAARMAERWRERIGRVLGYELSGRQPLILFASHPHFQQTNIVEGFIDPGTGGVTEGLRRRMAMPFAATLGESDHVIGHELVHAFQYDMLGRALAFVPLWFVEGMAEYLSVGPVSAQTAMWLRDAALSGDFPDIDRLDDPKFFPYRFGHAFWAYVGGRFGDQTIGRIMQGLSLATPNEGYDPFAAISEFTGKSIKELSADWRASVIATYGIEAPRLKVVERRDLPGVISIRTGSGRINIGPSLSPDGSLIAFLSERGKLSIEVYVADARTGLVINKLTETAIDPHFQSLQFLASAGSWSPKSDQLALAAIREARPVIALVDVRNGKIKEEYKFPEIGEIFQPAWSPDGRFIAFSGQTGGMTDLYLFEIATGQTRRLTNDPFSDLQPSWSPDGSTLVFITDRFTSNLEQLSFGRHRIGVFDVKSQLVKPLALELEADQVNPQYSTDGRWIYFISTHAGAADVYRVPPDGGAPTRVTEVTTGVTGITELSPALSVAGPRMAVSLFRESGYEIHLLDAGENALLESPRVRVTADLPPEGSSPSIVGDLLQAPTTGLPPADEKGEVEPYRPKLRLMSIGQAVGVSTGGALGARFGGGISLLFSDELGDHLLGTDFIMNGGARDIGGQAFYLNRSRRWYWGLNGQHVPLTSGVVRQGIDIVDGEEVFVEQLEIQRQTNTLGGVTIAYPVSRASRIEFNAAYRHIGFSREIEQRTFSLLTGNLLTEETFDLPAPESINMVDTSVAFVRDTSVFGATSPLRGQRIRVEAMPWFGDLQMSNLTVDVRQYYMPKSPVTFAFRGLHVGRYGNSAEDIRLTPFFIGYPNLVRGYDVNTFTTVECSDPTGQTCPVFDQLIGSKMIVGNFEVRAPLYGLLKGGRLEYGPVPVEVFGFVDTGMAWTDAQLPKFAGGTRNFVTSIGVGARVNVFGFLIAEFNMAHPMNRDRGWLFVFNLRPGF